MILEALLVQNEGDTWMLAPNTASSLVIVTNVECRVHASMPLKTRGIVFDVLY